MAQDPAQVTLMTLNYESLYYANLELLMHRFVQPLQKWGVIDPEDLKIMFQYVGDLYTITKTHVDTLGDITKEEELRDPSPAKIEVLVKLFTNPGLMDLYTKYTESFNEIEKAVERNNEIEKFWAYVSSQERQSNASLASLIKQPMIRVTVYADIVRKLLGCIPPNHGMRHKIEVASEQWDNLHERVALDDRMQMNAEKLASVELSFPTDRLELNGGRPADGSDPKRRWTVGRTRLGTKGMQKGCEVEQEYHKYSNMEYHIVLQMKTSGPRWYIEEMDGFDGLEKDGRKRRIHIFHDLLLISKPRTKGTYTLRRRYKLSESWIGENTEMDAARSLILGSPYHRKGVLSFATISKKRKFAETARRLIAEAVECEIEEERNGEISLFAFLEAKLDDTSAVPTFQPVRCGLMDSAADVIVATLRQIGGPDAAGMPDPRAFTLYELTSHGIMVVNVWECPLAIHRVGSRCHLHRARCQFVLRRRSDPTLKIDMLPATLQALITHMSTKAQRRQSESIHHGRILTTAEQLDQLHREKKKGFLKGITHGIGKRLGLGSTSAHDKAPMSPLSVAAKGPKKIGQLYSRPLDDIVIDGELPMPLQHMISRLYHDGPAAQGLFRKSANARVCRQVREHLDDGQDVDFAELPILAVGAILKEFLRALPDSVMTLALYDEMVAINKVKDEIERITSVAAVLKKLPASSRYLLGTLMPVFVQICEAHEENQMTPSNVGICIGQSLMWPRTTEDILKNDVPPFVEFLIVNYEALFGAEGAHVIFAKIEETGPDRMESMMME